MKRFVVASLMAALAVSCGDTTQTAVSQLNLDRPVDIAFSCFGGLRITNGGSADPSQDVVQSAQPTTSCDIRSQPHDDGTDQPTPPGQEQLTGSALLGAVQWYGFVLQSEPGTVAVTRWDTKPSQGFIGGDVTVLDADDLTPGQNGISVGEDPVAIATSREGCFEVTANAGSCDMSTLDITSAVFATAGDGHAIVNRTQVLNAAGVPIRSKPAAMVAQPAGGVIGAVCPAQPTGIVYVAYPSCHLVAGVDLATSTVVTGISYASGTPVIVDGNVTCPDECDGDVVAAGTRPVSISLENDTRVGTQRLAIGADNSSSIAVVELDPATSMPQSVSQVAFEDDTIGKTLGITDVAMSPVIGMGGQGGSLNDDAAPGGSFQFVYAVGTDHTVHVADVLVNNAECDTQVDPRLIRNVIDVKKLSCFPVGDPATPRRRPGAKGPGIELVGKAIPTSVEIFAANTFDGDARTFGPPTLIGYFAMVTAANGVTAIVNIDDDNYGDTVNTKEPFLTQIPLAIAHQLRDAIPDRDEADLNHDLCDQAGPDPDSQNGNSAGPRSPTPPVENIPTNTVAAAKANELPFIRSVLCQGTDDTKVVTELEFTAGIDERDLVFPDLRGLRSDENWAFTFEGSLSNSDASSDVDGPGIRSGMLAVQDVNGMLLQDETRPFCNAGVEPFDIVQLRGCDPGNGDSDCPLGYECYVHPDSQISGLGSCMLKDEADRLAEACKEYLVSLRRYTVGKSEAGQLTLIPRHHDLITTPLDGCTSDDECQTLANYQLTTASDQNPVDDKTPETGHTYKCVADNSRKPGNGNKCVEACTADADCDAGTVCSNGLCFEGVIPPQACVNSSQRFDVRAGEAFTAVGTFSGYVHPIIEGANGVCEVDPNAHPFDIGRIPLNPPACDPAADERTGLKPDGTYDANPCLHTITNEADNQPVYPDIAKNSCDPGNPTTTPVERDAQAIRFHTRGMTLDLVDPTYPGDATCIGDRGGSLVDVPMVPPGYTIQFRQTAGFVSLTLPIQPAYPVKVVRGPTQSIWVMDEGDFLSTSIVVPSTRGKVFRVEAINLGLINIVQ